MVTIALPVALRSGDISIVITVGRVGMIRPIPVAPTSSVGRKADAARRGVKGKGATEHGGGEEQRSSQRHRPVSMLPRAYEGENCSIAATLSIVGDRWTLLILREACRGVRRFADFQARLGPGAHGP